VKTLSLRPWNQKLKTLAHNIGMSFFYLKNKEDRSVYRTMMCQRLAYETEKNEAGCYAPQAAAILREVPDHKMRAVLATGKLTPGHLWQRARRYAAKQFLADFQAELYRFTFGKEPPAPYPIAILGHAHQRRDPSGQPPGLKAETATRKRATKLAA